MVVDHTISSIKSHLEDSLLDPLLNSPVNSPQSCLRNEASMTRQRRFSIRGPLMCRLVLPGLEVNCLLPLLNHALVAVTLVPILDRMHFEN